MPKLTAHREARGTSIPFGGVEINRIPVDDDDIPQFVNDAVVFRGDTRGLTLIVGDLRHIGSHITANTILKTAIQAACTCAGADGGDEVYERARDRLIALGRQTLYEGQLYRNMSFERYAHHVWGSGHVAVGDRIALMASALLYGLNKGINSESVHARGLGSGAGNELAAILAIDDIRERIRGERAEIYNPNDDESIGRVATFMNDLLDYNAGRGGEAEYIRAVCIRHLTLASVASGLDTLTPAQRGAIATRFMDIYLTEQGWNGRSGAHKENRVGFIGEVVAEYERKMQPICQVFSQTQGYGNPHQLGVAELAAPAAAAAVGARPASPDDVVEVVGSDLSARASGVAAQPVVAAAGRASAASSAARQLVGAATKRPRAELAASRASVVAEVIQVTDSEGEIGTSTGAQPVTPIAGAPAAKRPIAAGRASPDLSTGAAVAPSEAPVPTAVTQVLTERAVVVGTTTHSARATSPTRHTQSPHSGQDGRS